MVQPAHARVDMRVRPENPEKVAESITPDYALGSHVAALGLDFSSIVMGPEFAGGFRDDDGTTRGQPVGVTVDPAGALIVADDLSNTVWRIARIGGPAVDGPPDTRLVPEAPDAEADKE